MGDSDNKNENVIEHIILSGGGHNILSIFGALSFLKAKKYFEMGNVKSIDGTSAGAMLGFALLLGLNDDDIESYLVERPWESVFNITPELVFQSFQSKGLFDVRLIEQIFKPLLDAADIPLSITFKELYEKTKVEFTVYVTELNELKTQCISYKNEPDMRILEGIYRSSAIPPLFKPIIDNKCCFLDGGVFSNYPLDEFIERNPEVERKSIFGIKLLGSPNKVSDIITETSTITDYITSTIKKLIQQIIIHKDNNSVIPNELLFHSSTFTYRALKESISSQSERQRLMDEGKRRASEFYRYKNKE